jgi:hypothetical protein
MLTAKIKIFIFISLLVTHTSSNSNESVKYIDADKYIDYINLYVNSDKKTQPACKGLDINLWSDCFGSSTGNKNSTYVGEWKNGRPHGFGIATETGKWKYVGDFRDGKRQGMGIATPYPYLEKYKSIGVGYVGEWKDNKWDGFGKYVYIDGASYVGQWINNNQNGNGTLKYSDGKKYVGEWKNGLYHGQGILSYQDWTKSPEEGVWLENKLVKEQKILIADTKVPIKVELLPEKNESNIGFEYTRCRGRDITTWNNCVGAYTYSKETNPSTYIGVWKNGSPNGQGIMTRNHDLWCSKEALSGRKTYSDCIASYGGVTSVREGIWVDGSLSTSKNIDEKLKQYLLTEIDFKEPISANISNPAITSNTTIQITPPISSLPVTSSVFLPFTGKRLALVIGNASYKVRPLLNPRNDADDVSRVLRSTGFEVIDLRDATLAQMRTSVRQFGERLMSNDVGLVYYSGHGIEVKGRNYFIPVNADIKASDEVADQALDVSLILAKMDTAKKGVNILIVDACRDDPFGRSFRSNSRGLATMDAPQGTLIAYATAPGSVAADGTGRNSPFTKHLVRAMQVPNTPIELMFKEVRRAVREETKNQQTPWENSSLIGNFYFSVKK